MIDPRTPACTLLPAAGLILGTRVLPAAFRDLRLVPIQLANVQEEPYPEVHVQHDTIDR